MYRLTDFYSDVLNVSLPTGCGIYCNPVDKEITLRVNDMRQTLSCYIFTLITSGWLVIDYNGRKINFKSGDLYIYSPGFRLTIVNLSDDYKGYSLLAEESATLSMTTARNLIRAAYFPIIEMQEPKLSLSDSDAAHLLRQMDNFIDYQESDHFFKDECLFSLYSVFLLDLMDIQQRTASIRHFSERTEELFIGFIRLLPQHFAEHHDIGFYASALNITPSYISRIVRQITGRTVVDYINQMLMMEATFLLGTTSLNISQIAEKLHFADAASFSKFFLREKGCPPKKYRMGIQNG